MAEVIVNILVDRLVGYTNQLLTGKVQQIMEVEEEIGKLDRNLRSILAVLEDAERRQTNEAFVRDWLEKLKDVSYDIDDLLDEWNTTINSSNPEKQEKNAHASNTVRFSVCSTFLHKLKRRPSQLLFYNNIASKVAELNEKLNVICNERNRFVSNTIMAPADQPERQMTTSLIDVSEVCGREQEKTILVNKLLYGSNQDQSVLDNVIPIVGMGGIGKTTLAQLAYNDKKVKDHFELRIWICVSDPFDEIKIMRDIIEQLIVNAPNLTGLEALSQYIVKSLTGRKFLLVLDDVWTTDDRKWEQIKKPLQYGAPESRVLVTARKEEVATMMGAKNGITLQLLSEELCWSIFSKIAFFNKTKTNELENIGRKIALKCKGLPLVAKTLGSMMRLKNREEQWSKVLNNELWEIEDVHIKVFVPFLLSYRDLSAHEKLCLSYCCIFPKDHEIDRDDLIKLWMSQDYFRRNTNFEEQDLDCIEKYFEHRGLQCFENLAMRSFFQDFKRDCDGNIRKCKMHDVIHDFVLFLARNEYFMMRVCDQGSGIVTVNQANEKARHSTLLLESDSQIPSSMYEKKYLRTLYVSCSKNTTPLRVDLLANLKCLRTLHLSGGCIELLPEEIGKLVHLRYLSLSDNYHLRELPEAVCGLFNLTTLRINRCTEFQTWPKGMIKLRNLRYLYAEDCEKLRGPPQQLGSIRVLKMNQ